MKGYGAFDELRLSGLLSGVGNKKGLRNYFRRPMKIGVPDQTQTGDLLGHNQTL